jgi:hypothetical protein
MKMIEQRLATILLVLLVTGCGITAPQSNIGFADLDALSWRDVDTTMTLSLGPTALGFAAAMVDDDPEVQLLLDSLEGEKIAGMTVLTSDSAEVVLVNIMGEIQPEQFARVINPLT